MSVQRSQPSIKRGQTATYVVQVSTKNGSASGVTVKLAAQPSTVRPKFSSGCAKDDGTASCSIASVTDKQTVTLGVSVAVASNATSVSSVKLTATAAVATTSKWTPPAATETTAVTSASASASPSASAPDPPTGTSAGITDLSALPLGPIPSLNSAASVLIGAGNAAELFPAITAAPGASPGASALTQPSSRDTAPVSDVSPVSADTPASTAQVAGLIAVGLAIMLIATRLAVRKRSRPGGPRS